MTRQVKISELKAKLSEHLRYVKRGHTIEVMDRDTPVAAIVPLEANGLIIHKATRKMRDFVPPPPIKSDVDVVALLREDRDAR